MRKIVVFMSMTLDGVMQAPERPNEDLRGNFQHRGWAFHMPIRNCPVQDPFGTKIFTISRLSRR
jgi:hypothetical protein